MISGLLPLSCFTYLGRFFAKTIYSCYESGDVSPIIPLKDAPVFRDLTNKQLGTLYRVMFTLAVPALHLAPDCDFTLLNYIWSQSIKRDRTTDGVGPCFLNV